MEIKCDKYEDCSYRGGETPKVCTLKIYRFCNFYDKVEKTPKDCLEHLAKQPDRRLEE